MPKSISIESPPCVAVGVDPDLLLARPLVRLDHADRAEELRQVLLVDVRRQASHVDLVVRLNLLRLIAAAPSVSSAAAASVTSTAAPAAPTSTAPKATAASTPSETHDLWPLLLYFFFTIGNTNTINR